MTTNQAARVLMWLAGMLAGAGVMKPDAGLMVFGALFTALAVFYSRRFCDHA